MIFSRGRRGSGRHARPEDSRRPTRPGAGGFDDGFDDGNTVADEHAQGAPAGSGPFDSSHAPPDVPRLDLGSLLIPAVEGVEVRVQANPDGAIQQVVLVHGDSALQLGVFAAPKSEGIWDEVRTEIRDSLFADGMAAQEVAGDHGVELRARVRTPEGLTDLRFVGVDGPRWMLRAVYQGAAAVDPVKAGPLVECLRGVVVQRGPDAKPVREPLELRLPREATGAVAASADGGDGAPPAAGGPALTGGPAPATGGAGPGVAGPGAAAPPGAGAQPPRRKPSPRPRRPS